MTIKAWRLTWAAPMFMPAVALAVGILAGQHVEMPTCWLLFLSLLVCAVLLYCWPRCQSVALLLSVAALGAIRSSSVRGDFERTVWPDGVVSCEAVVVSEVVEKPKTMATDVVVSSGQKLKCYIAKDTASQLLTIGDRLQLRSHIEGNREWRQGTFDYRRYQEVHGFKGQMFVRRGCWQLLDRSWDGLPVWQRLRLSFLDYRHRLLQRYRQAGFSGDEYAVVAAMTLGDKSAMSHELKEVYAVSGASHVLALSGLHLGIVYMVLSLLVVGRRWRFVTQLLAVLGIWAFALLVGLPASVVRSAVMITVYGLLSLAHRGHPSLNALALASLLILVVSPYSLFDVGFQLSFAAMLAILTVQPVISGVVGRQWLMEYSVVRWLWGLATVSVAAQVGTAPLVAYYFGRFSTWFLLTNFVVIPATTVILWLAIATLAVPALGAVLLRVVGWLNGVLTLLATRLPCPSIEGLHPTVVQTVAVYVVVLGLLMIVLKYDKRI
ncbi:MAG: ComEC/Rec2 family competence protein [Prevotella sp.]|nr:ComEC/Rec2 family competence protein [Prevotella sp.]